RTAAEVHDREGAVGGTEFGGGPEERQTRLLVAGDDVGNDTEDREDAGEEIVAVLHIATGRSGDESQLLRLVLRGHLGEFPGRREGALERLGSELAGRVDVLAEANDPSLTAQVGQSAVSGDIGDEQAQGVRPTVESGNAHGRVLVSRFGGGSGLCGACVPG